MDIGQTVVNPIEKQIEDKVFGMTIYIDLPKKDTFYLFSG
jgi:hypothetical protein